MNPGPRGPESGAPGIVNPARTPHPSQARPRAHKISKIAAFKNIFSYKRVLKLKL